MKKKVPFYNEEVHDPFGQIIPTHTDSGFCKECFFVNKQIYLQINVPPLLPLTRLLTVRLIKDHLRAHCNGRVKAKLCPKGIENYVSLYI